MKVICGIPIYNEEQNLPQLLDDFPMAMRRRVPDYLIIAVNDGSTDGSQNILESFAQKVPLEIVQFKNRRGLAAVFSTLLEKALAFEDEDVFVLMEGDGTSSPFCVPFMAEKIMRGADIVICSRFHFGGGVEQFPLHRRLGSKLINVFLAQAFPYPKLRDYTTFFRAYRIGFLRKLHRTYGSSLIRQQGFAVNGELLLKSLPLKPNIEEMAYLYPYGRKKSKSKLKIIPTCYGYLLLLSELIFATP